MILIERWIHGTHSEVILFLSKQPNRWWKRVPRGKRNQSHQSSWGAWGNPCDTGHGWRRKWWWRCQGMFKRARWGRASCWRWPRGTGRGGGWMGSPKPITNFGVSVAWSSNWIFLEGEWCSGNPWPYQRIWKEWWDWRETQGRRWNWFGGSV